jgi:PAS domain S-box-containing protein
MVYFYLLLLFTSFSLTLYFFRLLKEKQKEAGKLLLEKKELSAGLQEEKEKRQQSEILVKQIESQFASFQTDQRSQIIKMERFRLLVEDTEAYLCELNYKGQIEYVNPAVLNKLGYSEEEIKGQNIIFFSPEAQRSKIIQFYENQYRLKKADTYSEWEVTNRFGENFRVGCRVKMEFFPDGKIESVKAISHDLTVLSSGDKMHNFREMEPLLNRFQESMMCFHKAAKSAELAHYQLKWVNKATLSLMNFDWFEVENITLEDVSESLLQLIKNKISWPEKEMVWQSPRITDRSFLPIIVFQENQLLIALIDQTSAHRNLTRAEQERDFFKSVLEQTQLDVAVIANDSRFLYLNPAAVTDKRRREWLTGMKDEDYIKQRYKSLNKALLRKTRINDIRNHKKSIRYEDIRIDAEKNLQVYIREITPCLSEAGELLYFAVFGQNLTDRYNQLEHQLEISDKWSFICRIEELRLLENKPMDAMDNSEKNLLRVLGDYLRLREASQLLVFSKNRKRSAFYLYPFHPSHFSDFFTNYGRGWTGIQTHIHTETDVDVIFLFPKILVQETLEKLSDWSGNKVTDVHVFWEKGEGGKYSITLMMDSPVFATEEQTEFFFRILLRIWEEEGFRVSLSEGRLKMEIPISPSEIEINEEVAQSIQILQRQKIILGPAIEKATGWLSQKLRENGADPVLIQNSQGINRYLSQGSFSLVIWWGHNFSELEGLDHILLREQGIKVLFLHEGAVSGQIPEGIQDMLVPFQFTGSVLKIIEQIWLHVSQEVSEPVLAPEIETQKLNFMQLLEITEGDKNFIATLMKTYFTSLAECRHQFEDLIENENAEGLRFLLHKIRATTKTFDIRSLEEALRKSISHLDAKNRVTKKLKKEWSQNVNQICEDAGKQILDYCRLEGIPLK